MTDIDNVYARITLENEWYYVRLFRQETEVYPGMHDYVAIDTRDEAMHLAKRLLRQYADGRASVQHVCDITMKEALDDPE